MNNRKPDVLPVEGASIAEALDALEKLCQRDGCIGDASCNCEYSTIRSALERAAAEGERAQPLVGVIGDSVMFCPESSRHGDPWPKPAPPAPRSEPSALPCKACGGCGLVHYRARGGSITGSGPCACRTENHLKGKR